MTLTVPLQAKQPEMTKKHVFPEGEHIEALKPTQGITESDEIEQTDSGAYVCLVALTAYIGGILFGYDTGIISAVLVYITTVWVMHSPPVKRRLHLSVQQGPSWALLLPT